MRYPIAIMGLLLAGTGADAAGVRDATGRMVTVPDRVERVMAAGPAAAVVLYVLEGYGIVLSTHDPDHALLVATRVAIIADGGLRAVGPPQHVVTAEMLSAIYRTEVIVEDTPSGRRVCVPAWGRA
jgi:ABC-type Fe3+-hydroxamate transport system substrate-binding protein